MRADAPAAKRAIGFYQDVFGKENFYLEFMDHDLEEQRKASEEEQQRKASEEEQKRKEQEQKERLQAEQQQTLVAPERKLPKRTSKSSRTSAIQISVIPELRLPLTYMCKHPCAEWGRRMDSERHSAQG